MDIVIRETTQNDLKAVQSLWADGDTMKFVGFPKGLHETDESMEQWYRWIQSARPLTNHYSIFADERYCGETFYQIDTAHKSASMDIKLFGFARGKGIAAAALSFAVGEAFKNGAASVWVDPNPLNLKAIALYEKLKFERKNMPEYLTGGEEPTSIYMELRK